MTDARFDRVQKVEHHPDADTLDIVTVSNYPCIVKRGEFSVGEWVFYIREDSKLLGWDEWQERINRDREAEKTGDFVTQDEFTCTWHWQDNLLKYLGNGGRVKSIKIRGKVSMGILLKLKDVIPLNLAFINNDYLCGGLNAIIGNPDSGAKFLEQNFGISHWSAPTTGFGSMNVKYNNR